MIPWFSGEILVIGGLLDWMVLEDFYNLGASVILHILYRNSAYKLKIVCFHSSILLSPFLWKYLQKFFTWERWILANEPNALLLFQGFLGASGIYALRHPDLCIGLLKLWHRLLSSRYAATEIILRYKTKTEKLLSVRIFLILCYGQQGCFLTGKFLIVDVKQKAVNLL